MRVTNVVYYTIRLFPPRYGNGIIGSPLCFTPYCSTGQIKAHEEASRTFERREEQPRQWRNTPMHGQALLRPSSKVQALRCLGKSEMYCDLPGKTARGTELEGFRQEREGDLTNSPVIDRIRVRGSSHAGVSGWFTTSAPWSQPQPWSIRQSGLSMADDWPTSIARLIGEAGLACSYLWGLLATNRTRHPRLETDATALVAIRLSPFATAG